jgi:hypothetical protein
MNIKFANASIVTAFDSVTIGSKVTNPEEFHKLLAAAVEAHDDSKDRAPGQHFVRADALIPHVSAGVGKRSMCADDFVKRSHRGVVGLFLKREFAAPCESCAVIVYTVDALKADPQSSPEEIEHAVRSEATHIIVAVLASAGPPSPYSPERFVANLAGGNNEAALWGADEIRQKAKEVHVYHEEWAVVAD